MTTNDAETTLPALEREWMEAWRLKDRATCERLLAEDFLLIAFGSRHRVLITRPDGESVEAVASVEAVRKDSLAFEFPALLFESLAAGDVVLGSSISILGEVRDA